MDRVVTSPRFPRMDGDGGFHVEIGLAISPGTGNDLAARIQAWVDRTWMPRNAVWRRHWRSGPGLSSERVEMLSYGDSFVAPPEAKASGNAELSLLLHGTNRSAPWRDWVVSKLLPELEEEFTEVGDRLFVRNTPEPKEI